MNAVNFVSRGGGGWCSIDAGNGSDVAVISSATSGKMDARKRINAKSLMVPCCIQVKVRCGVESNFEYSRLQSSPFSFRFSISLLYNIRLEII